MKRTSILLGIFGLAIFAPAQVKMKVEMGGKAVGTASVTHQLKGDGSKTVELKVEWVSGGTKLTVRSQNAYDPKGLPTRKFMESIIPGGKLQRQVIASFDKDGSNLVILDGERRETKKAPLVPTAPRANLSEFWFLRDQPKPGQKVDCYVLNMDTLAWELQTIVYKGARTVDFGGKKVRVHEVETNGSRKVKAWLDDHGLPWLIETGALTMKRISEN